MKKLAIRLMIISITVLIIDWGFIGLKLLNGDYNITLGAYIALICILIFFTCVIYTKFHNKCPHCKKLLLQNGKYCPYCGKEI